MVTELSIQQGQDSCEEAAYLRTKPGLFHSFVFFCLLLILFRLTFSYSFEACKVDCFYVDREPRTVKCGHPGLQVLMWVGGQKHDRVLCYLLQGVIVIRCL